jgi:hypothetical protein
MTEKRSFEERCREFEVSLINQPLEPERERPKLRLVVNDERLKGEEEGKP